MFETVLSAAAGVAGWSASEYLIHRFLGHEWAKKHRNAFSVEHVKHHATTSYFAPSWKKGLAAVAASAVMAPVTSLLLGRRAGLAFTAGYVTMYLTYEVLHRRAHTHAPTGPYSRWVRRNHFAHHFMSPKDNHGVTSPFWDHVFGTARPLDDADGNPIRIKVPARHAMPWLVNEHGELRPEFAADYELVVKGKPERVPTPRAA
ncbi:MAG TPA: hypothetical protein ENK57_07325 [Polyangiaceae bacterium]|nr:hypothetical protein [Polyangiaceae bacterium]